MHAGLAFVALAVALLGATPAAAQACANGTRLQFRRLATPGGRVSYINAENQPVNVAMGRVVPAVVVDIIAADAAGRALGFDDSMDGATVLVTVTPSLRIGGNTVEANRGQALFDSLSVQDQPQPGTDYRMTFSLNTGAEILTLTTGRLVFVSTSPPEPTTLRFGLEGFFNRAGQSKEIPYNAPIPTFFLQVLDATGYELQRSTADAPISVTVADVTATGTPAGGTFSRTVFSGTESVQVTGLRYTPLAGVATVTFTFTATVARSSSTPWVQTISTGTLSPTVTAERNKFMQFAPTSFIQYDGQGISAVLDIPLPPIIIHLYTSAMEHDVSNTGLVISASTEQGFLRGAEALVVRGVATFADLAFTTLAPRSAVLTFTAGSQGSLPVFGSTLYTGAVSVAVTAIKAKRLAFAKRSFVQEAPQRHILKMQSADSQDYFIIPNVVVRMLDSASQIDSTANNIDITVIAQSTPSVQPNRQTQLDATIVNGMAVYNNMRFEGSRPAEVRLVISNPSTTGDTQPLYSGIIDLVEDRLDVAGDAAAQNANARSRFDECKPENAANCIFSLKFADDFGSQSSHVYRQEQQTFTTAGAQIPTIRVQLHDVLGPVRDKGGVNAETVPTIIAFTGDDPGGEELLVRTNGANEGKFQPNGLYVFSCLQFQQAPSGLVRIQFIAVDKLPGGTGNIPYQSINRLRTGFVTVTPAPVGNYGLRFAPTDSLLSYEGMRSSAVLNTPILPPITIDVVDSKSVFDSNTPADLVIRASSSSGRLDGNQVQVVNGRATFSSLKFSSIADEPTLTFTAHSADTNVAVAGTQISSGVMTLTALPIPAFEVAFSAVADNNNNVTRNFQPFNFNNISDVLIKVSIVIRDSAHQVESSVTDAVVIDASSDEGILVAPPQTIDSSTPCACANMTAVFRGTGYRPGFTPGTPLFIRFTVSAPPPPQRGNPLLIGQTLVVGPITITGSADATQSCQASPEEQPVVGEFKTPKAAFLATIEQTRSRLAFLMGIEASRVAFSLPSIRTIHRVDHATLAPWEGTKATLKFLEPVAASTNRKSSAQLSEEFVSLRPRCEAQQLLLEAVYYAKDDKSCDPAKFQSELTKARTCTTLGELTQCSCFARDLMQGQGPACSDDTALANTLLGICQELTACAEADIQNVCDTVLATQQRSLIWLWATLGAVGGVVLIVGFLRHKGILAAKKKASLHHDDEH